MTEMSTLLGEPRGIVWLAVTFHSATTYSPDSKVESTSNTVSGKSSRSLRKNSSNRFVCEREFECFVDKCKVVVESVN